ncbi:hypothetical protein V2G26_015087 [Clonostachys chloroleuca]
MIRSKSRSPPLPYLPPTPRELSPRPESAFEDFILFDAPETRPSSGAFASSVSSPRSDMGARPPTLSEILLDQAPPPWSLAAFTAYLSNNHCMETLEFTLDLRRYSDSFALVYGGNQPAVPNDVEYLSNLWDRLIAVYITPCSAREINIPSRVRDQLLSLSSRPTPPHPSVLEEAGRIIHELMNDSVLVPFLESLPPYFNIARGRTSPRSSSRTGSSHEMEGLTDDSEGGSPAAMEPMTPPTTPPSSTDWGFNNSPARLQPQKFLETIPPTSSVPGHEANRHGNIM